VNTDRTSPKSQSLWRVPALWLMIGGPAVVVVASLATLVVALRNADPPVQERAVAPSADSMTPAVQARNHVAASSR